jgi:hypothetical protein
MEKVLQLGTTRGKEPQQWQGRRSEVPAGCPSQERILLERAACHRDGRTPGGKPGRTDRVGQGGQCTKFLQTERRLIGGDGQQTLAIVIAQRHRIVERASDDDPASDDEENGEGDGANAALDKPQVKTTDYGVFGLEHLAEESLFFFFLFTEG